MNRPQPPLQRIPVPRAIAAAAMLCIAASGHTTEIATGDPDLSVRFDNTVKYNYAYRTSSQNQAILKSVNNDDGDRNFNVGIVSDRLDLLSEFDVVWQNRMGFRVSGAAWDDAAYNHLDNTNVATSNHLGPDGKPAIGLSDYASRYYKGLSGEVLDAFMFGRVNIGDMPVNVKLGQHTLYWGESVLSPSRCRNMSALCDPAGFGPIQASEICKELLPFLRKLANPSYCFSAFR